MEGSVRNRSFAPVAIFRGWRRRPPDGRRGCCCQAVRKGELIFEQGAPSDTFYTIASGRVKIFKRFASGKDLILEVFG
jgi:hypothetical protein